MTGYKKISALFMCFLVFVGCGGSNIGTNPPPADPIEVQEIIDSGWGEFEKEHYTSAITLFNQAREKDNTILDSFNGLGWSYFQIHNLNTSLFHFSTAVSADSAFTDAVVGFSIAAFEKSEYDDAISSITRIATIDSAAFDLRGSDEYIFEHDKSVTSRQVRKILALSYYYSGNFTSSMDQLKNYLDPFTSVSPESGTFLIDLLKALEIQ